MKSSEKNTIVKQILVLFAKQGLSEEDALEVVWRLCSLVILTMKTNLMLSVKAWAPKNIIDWKEFVKEQEKDYLEVEKEFFGVIK